jgi:hypothetical protein
VLTFNTLDGSADVTELAEVIRTARPDLAALIEVGQTYRARLAPLVEPLGYRMVTATGTDIDGVTDVYGVTALVAEHLRGATSNIDMSTPSRSWRSRVVISARPGSWRSTRSRRAAVTSRSGARTWAS